MSEPARKFVIACDSFKGTLSSGQVAGIVAIALREAHPEAVIRSVPMGDGGEGTMRAIVESSGGRVVPCDVHDPLGRPVTAELGILPGGACVIEMASSTGLTLVEPGLRDPLTASSYGFGELIGRALDEGCERLHLCIGGSATNDAGMGAMRALGMRFLDAAGCELEGRGCDLPRVSEIDASALDARLSRVRTSILSDVTSPLLGPRGASLLFGEQKGATPADARLLEEGMRSYADVLERWLGRPVRDVAGAGAAGGMGSALMAFLGAEMRSGADAVLDLVGFDALLVGADACITGEGCLDGQTAQGKVAERVAARCARAGVACHAIVGMVGEGADACALGLSSVESCSDAPYSPEGSRAHPEEALLAAAVRLAGRL